MSDDRDQQRILLNLILWKENKLPHDRASVEAKMYFHTLARKTDLAVLYSQQIREKMDCFAQPDNEKKTLRKLNSLAQTQGRMSSAVPVEACPLPLPNALLAQKGLQLGGEAEKEAAWANGRFQRKELGEEVKHMLCFLLHI